MIMFQVLLNWSYNQMNNQFSGKEKFIEQQVKIGITSQNYQAKYKYHPEQSSENYLLNRHAPTPSQLQGFTIEQQKSIGYLMSEVIFRACESLQLPVSTAVVSSSIAHFYYSRVGFLHEDFRDIVMGALFLGCKSQETLRFSYEISAVCDHIFKIFEGDKMPIKIQILNSAQYEYMKKKVIESEKKILFELGFEVYRLLQIPHRFIGGLLSTFDRHPQGKTISQNAWTYLNDFYRTNVCVYYPGEIIATAAVYLALLKLKLKMPPVSWWTLFEANLESIEQLIGQFEYFSEISKSSTYTMEWASNVVSEIGKINHLVNVFPLKYYRKIQLDTKSVLKITKKQLQQREEEQKQLKQSKQTQKLSQSNFMSLQKPVRKKNKRKRSSKQQMNKKDERNRSYSSNRNIESDSDSYSVALKQQKNNEELSKINQNTSHVGQERAQIDDQKKNIIQKLKLGNPKDVLLTVGKQLQKIKKRQVEVQMKRQQQQQNDEEQEQLLADLIQKKKENEAKKLQN